MSEITKRDPENARHDPELAFDHPMEVVKELGMTRGQKIATLARWKTNLEDRIRATGEGMSPPAGQTADEAAVVAEIGKALEQLNQASD